MTRVRKCCYTLCQLIALVLIRIRQRVPSKNPFFDWSSLFEVLMHEERNSVGGHAAVPSAFGIDDHDRTAIANTKTIDFGSVAGIWAGAHGQAAFFEFALEFLPSCLTHVRWATVWTQTQKHVSLQTADAVGACDFFQLFLWLVQSIGLGK